MTEEHINPIKITDVETGEVYELDFNRDTVWFMDQNKFKLDDVTDFPATGIPKLFYYAFRWHHKKLSKGQTDKLLEKLGGVTPKIIERLIQLYSQAATANNVQDDEDLEKNSRMTVEF